MVQNREALAVKHGVADTMAARSSSSNFSSFRQVDPLDDELVSAALGASVGVRPRVTTYGCCPQGYWPQCLR